MRPKALQHKETRLQSNKAQEHVCLPCHMSTILSHAEIAAAMVWRCHGLKRCTAFMQPLAMRLHELSDILSYSLAEKDGTSA